ncbi:6786_t:CDS:2 [Diversispora eburnea]|uniref:6786_t:CDS:1 n=1 Tax=Diversispora eburnea TaxID=1213867 RepID=A0A9N9F7R1_9GLOM|nr:6786_t:CDS:2 [Diversispora eburnea]
MTSNEHIRNTMIMPSQTNEMLSYGIYNDNASHLTACSEGDNLFQEETGKYDLDTVSVFVAKLYQLLESDEYKEYLTWNETGDVFVICNMDEFAQNVLPKYFKHCKFTSFVRQLNIYGFYRVSDARKSKHVRSKHACVFSHSQFRRSRQDLLPNIRRKVSKTPRRKMRPSDSSISQNQGEPPNTVSSPTSIYGGSPVNNKNGNTTKDSPSQHHLLSSYESKDFMAHVDKSDSDIAMRKRIAELTTTTENLRKDLKHMNEIVNERLLPEVRSLTEDLQKHHTHLMQLTQLVTYHSSPEELQLFQEVNRCGYTRHVPSHDIPSPKRLRLNDKQTTSIKTEQSNLSPTSVVNPTVPSSVPAPYGNIFASHPNHHDNNLMNGNSSSTSSNTSINDSTMQVTSSVSQPLTISTDSHPAFNTIMGEFQQHSSPNSHTGITNFSDSFLMQDSVNTVPISLSPTEYGDNTNSSDIISNVVTASNSNTSNSTEDHRNRGGSSSPHNHGDVLVAVSPTSTTTSSSSPMSQPVATSMPNYYQNQIDISGGDQ